MPVTYGGTNDLLQQCPRCQRSIDTHKIPFMRPDPVTEKIVKKAQSNLDGQIQRSTIKGFDPLRDMCMIGAAQALIKNGTYQFLTISGAVVDALKQVSKRDFGDVEFVIVENANPLLCYAGGTLNLGQPARQGRGRDYPIGSCAAPKLLNAIFAKADSLGGRSNIKSISLAEIFWTGTAVHNRDWSTGEIVVSCDTCKRVVPAMLCSNE